jgi:hypothetical protein
MRSHLPTERRMFERTYCHDSRGHETGAAGRSAEELQEGDRVDWLRQITSLSSCSGELTIAERTLPEEQPAAFVLADRSAVVGPANLTPTWLTSVYGSQARLVGGASHTRSGSASLAPAFTRR